MQMTINASELHLTDKLLVRQITDSTNENIEIELRSVHKDQDKGKVYIETKRGVKFQYHWNQAIRINRGAK